MALHGTPEEIAFVLDLVNSINHPTATRLRHALEPVVRSHDRFKLEIERKIELCSYCGGSQKRRVGNTRENYYDIEPCEKCAGEGSMVKITSVRYEVLTEESKIEHAI